MPRLRSGSVRCLLAVVAAAVLLPRSATAQAVTGTISGTVVDPQGQVIPGATVTVTNEANNDARLAVTDPRGDFQVTNLQPSRYTVRADHAGGDPVHVLTKVGTRDSGLGTSDSAEKDGSVIKFTLIVTFLGGLIVPAVAAAQNPHLVVYEGTNGPGTGKHIVFLAGDHEYRSEETLPALARILARHYGFKCSVFFTTNPRTGFIEPGSSNIAGLEALRTADLLVVFLRFQDFPDEQMQHLADYLTRGGPVVGFRTATHAFQIKRPDARFVKYHWQTGDEYKGGFGRQILGETWVSHYGTNHKQSSRLLLQADQSAHPILRGVKNVWVQSGGYMAHPIEGSQILATGQILDGMTPDAPPATGKEEVPVAWYRTYTSSSGNSGRVFTTTHGASEDLLNDGFRRMAVNACLWAAGLEQSIQPSGDISFVGPYQPTTFSFGGYVKGVKPVDVAGWDAPILPKTPK